MATQIQDPLFDPLVGAVEEYYKDDPIAKNTAKKSISAAFTTNPTQLEINRKQFETLLQVRPFSKDKPTDYTTYASCLRKFPLQSNCVSSRQVAAELNIDVKGKNDIYDEKNNTVGGVTLNQRSDTKYTLDSAKLYIVKIKGNSDGMGVRSPQ